MMGAGRSTAHSIGYKANLRHKKLGETDQMANC